ncbi:MAG: hypothetical protein ACE5EO_08005 [Candidatus Krumholzibacteriia bacterium]
MTAQRYTPDTIARAEQLVSRIQGISSCRISTDETGEITEVHVVATSPKPPKLVARDVESCLKAEVGVSVDYKKIGVVVFDRDPESGEETAEAASEPRAEPVLEFPVEEFPARFAFHSVNLFISPNSVQAEVELLREGVETLGTGRSENSGGSHMRVVAQATLNAVSELLDGEIRLCLADVVEILLGDDTAVVVKVNLLQSRESKSLSGCSLYCGDANQTVVYATLAAVNRILGVLKARDSVEYKIK